jgi:hypothetical protein
MCPHERSLVKRFEDQPFALIGVNSDSRLDELKLVLERERITWRSFWNGPEGIRGSTSMQWNVKGWPPVHVLDHEGGTRYKTLRDEALDQPGDTLMIELEEARAGN